MRTNRELLRAVRRALATGTIAVCGVGCLAAHAQQTSGNTSGANKAQVTQVKSPKSKKIQLAQAKSPKSKKIQLAQANGNDSNPILVAQATPAAAPAASNANAVMQLQQIVITGSLIERTGIETPNPVQVISSKDLVQSGYTDISDVMRNITANGANTLTRSFSFAFAGGGSGISLRGLTLGDTLVLIDGERSVPYPLLDDNERSFTDLSSIPFTAVQQVQVLKDGGSALYGSDAIAGVVNVILRKTYQGLQVTAEGGTSQHFDGTMEHLGFIGGHGDLASDGYNFYLSGDFRHQDAILASSRSGLWDNLNFYPWGGNNLIKGANPAENAFTSGYPQSSTGYLVDPTSGNVTYYFPGCDAVSQSLDRCLAQGPNAQIMPNSTDTDLLGKFTKSLGGDWEFGLQASWFDASSVQMAQMDSVGPSANSNIGLVPGQAPTVTNYPAITVPAGYDGIANITDGMGNTVPFDTPQSLVYNFPELGEANTTFDTNTYRLMMYLSGTAAGWKLKATVGAGYARDRQDSTGNIQFGALQTALDNGYLLGSPSGTELFAPHLKSTDTSNLALVDIHGTHELFQMPGGPLSLALGVQWFKEGHDVRPPVPVELGIATGDSIYAIGNEYDRAAFAELEGNPVKQLNFDAQVRYDNYQTFGADVTPNFGVKFTPWQWIAVRGTWGKGFRAPSVAEGVSSGEAFGEGTSDDPMLCPNPADIYAPGNFPSQCAAALTGVLTANPHLKDVTSTNWTAGLILQPIPAANASIDYYNIVVNNDIVGANSLASFVGSPVRGPQIVAPECPPTHSGDCSAGTGGGLVNTLTPVGTIVYLPFPYENASSTAVSGYDVDFQYNWDWGSIGRFTAEGMWTHEITYKLSLNGVTTELAGTHGPASVSGDTGNPKDRITGRLSWQKGPLTVTPSISYISHFTITDPSAGFKDCGSALTYDGFFPGGVTAANAGFCNVNYFLETDLYASYQVTGNLEVHASVTNLFNKTPPVDVMTYGSGSYFYPYDAAFAEDGAIGRFMTLGFTLNF
jgi:iron complex outermembrane recepter protein